MYFVGWGLTCVGFGLTLGLFLRKERKDNAALQVKEVAEAKAKLLHRLEQLEQGQVQGAAEREAQNHVLDKMSDLHEQVIRVVAGHDGTRREIDDLKGHVRDIRQELRQLRAPYALNNGS